MKVKNPLALSLILAALLVAGSVWAKDRPERAFLGIEPGEVTSDIAADYGVKAGEGVLVEGVVSDSPAKEAGLRTNDVIVSIGGSTPTGPDELRVQLKKYKPGDKVELTYLRGGQRKTLEITLAKSNDSEETWGNWMGTPPQPLKIFGDRMRIHGGKQKVAYAGIVTQKLSSGLAKYFKVEAGALVSDVVEDSPAEKAGLLAGDIIIKIGDEDIEDDDDVREAIRDHEPGDTVAFVIMRDGSSKTLSVVLGENESMFGWNMEGLDKDAVKDIHESLRDLKIDLDDMPDVRVQVHPDHTRIRVAVCLSDDSSRGILEKTVTSLGDKMSTAAEEVANMCTGAVARINDLRQRIATKVVDMVVEPVLETVVRLLQFNA